MSEGSLEGHRGLAPGFAAGLRVAGYRLEEEIGAGGMAVVFRARDQRLDRVVALKVLAPGLAADEEFRRRFLREVRAAVAVDDEPLCGGVPFERDQDVAVLWAHLFAAPPPVASRREGLPPGVDEVLGRALAKALQDRYASCGEFAGALRRGLGLPGYDCDPGTAAAVPAAAGTGRAGRR